MVLLDLSYSPRGFSSVGRVPALHAAETPRSSYLHSSFASELEHKLLDVDLSFDHKE